MGKVFVEAHEVGAGRFIDARYNLQDKQWGKQQYNSEHIEGALYWDLEGDLSDLSRAEGRHPMPSKDQLKTLFEQSGLTKEDTIYVYDQGGAPFAARAWWMLKYANFQNVYIVNGGFAQLKAKGAITTSVVPTFSPTTLEINWNESIYANRQDVKKIVDGKDEAILLDARAAVRYRGEQETIDPIAGHIPTAKNFDWEQLKEGLRIEANNKLLEKVRKEEEVVVYCGSGVTASPLYAVLANEGYENLRLYVGSYSDWIAHYEVETEEN